MNVLASTSIDVLFTDGSRDERFGPRHKTKKNSLRPISDASIFARSYECIACIMLFVTTRASRDAQQYRRFHRGNGESTNSITEIQMAAKKGRKAAKKGGAKKAAKKGGAKRKAAKKGGAKKKAAKKRR